VQAVIDLHKVMLETVLSGVHWGVQRGGSQTGPANARRREREERESAAGSPKNWNAEASALRQTLKIGYLSASNEPYDGKKGPQEP